VGQTVRRVVLVGGGHAHVQVLERWPTASLRDVELIVVSDRARAVYSGMVPGLVTGQYQRSELEIDVEALARRAGARMVLGAARRIDAEARRVEIEGHEAIDYDIASLNVGSTVRGLTTPGVAEHALPTRPIGEFIDALRRELADNKEIQAIVVGAGAGGVELALALDAVASADGRGGSTVTLVDSSVRALAGYPAAVSRRIHEILHRRGILLQFGVGVAGVGSEGIHLEDGRTIHSNLTVWAAGAAAHAFLASSGLPVDVDGFVQVDGTLQVRGFPELLAAGDCASHANALPKAGVYAVRQASTLANNIVALLKGRAPREYVPQGDFLTLLNLGDGTAMGTKWGASAQGRSLRWVKDRIDQRFVRRFHA